jgi:hypothetical protein
MVHMLRPEPDDRTVTEPEPASLRLFHRYLQPFTSPYTFHSLVVHLPSDLLQQSGDPPVPIPAKPGREIDDVGHQGFFIVSDFQDMALGGSWLRESTASPSFRDFRVNLLNALYEHAATRRA